MLLSSCSIFAKIYHFLLTFSSFDATLKGLCLMNVLICVEILKDLLDLENKRGIRPTPEIDAFMKVHI